MYIYEVLFIKKEDINKIRSAAHEYQLQNEHGLSYGLHSNDNVVKNLHNHFYVEKEIKI